MKDEFSEQMFEKCSNIKFHGNHSSGSRVVHFGQRDMTLLRVTFHNLKMHLRSIVIYSFMSNLGMDICLPKHPGETFCVLILSTVWTS